MWISALLVGACVLAVLATDTCNINDFTSCGVSPDEDACPSQSLNRPARSTKYSYSNKYSRKHTPPRRQTRRRVARDVDNLPFQYDDEEYQDMDEPRDNNPHSARVRSYREVESDGGDDSFGQNQPPSITDDQPHYDHKDAHYMREAHAKVCPHCNQALPAEMFHHPPVDPRVFRQFQQYPHMVHPYMSPMAHPHFTPGDEDGDQSGLDDEMETQLLPPNMYNQSIPMMYNPAWAPVPMVPPGMMVAPGVAPNPAAPPMSPPPQPPVMPPMPEVPVAEEPQESTFS